jgi:hypothetical protein
MLLRSIVKMKKKYVEKNLGNLFNINRYKYLNILFIFSIFLVILLSFITQFKDIYNYIIIIFMIKKYLPIIFIINNIIIYNDILS